MVPMAGSMVLQVASPWLCPNLFGLHAGDFLVLVVIAAGGQGRHLVDELQDVEMVWGASFLMTTVFIVVCCGSSAHAHNRANFDHEMVLMSSVEKAAEVSSQSRPSARGLNRQQHQASARERLARHGIIIHSVKLYTYVFFFHAVTN